eukprot:PhM_4_TR17904/c1_g1_i1/m.64733
MANEARSRKTAYCPTSAHQQKHVELTILAAALLTLVAMLAAPVDAVAGSIEITGTSGTHFVIDGHLSPTVYMMRAVNYTWTNRAWPSHPIEFTDPYSTAFASSSVVYGANLDAMEISLRVEDPAPGWLYYRSTADSTIQGRVVLVSHGACYAVLNDFSCSAVPTMCEWDVATSHCYRKSGPKVLAISGCVQAPYGTVALGCRHNDRITITGLDFGAHNRTSGMNVTLVSNTTGSQTANSSATCVVEKVSTPGNSTVCILKLKQPNVPARYTVYVTWAHRRSAQTFVILDTTPTVPTISSASGCDGSHTTRLRRCDHNGTVITLHGAGFASSPSGNAFRFLTDEHVGAGTPTCTSTTGSSAWSEASCNLNFFTGRATGQFSIQAAVTGSAWSSTYVSVTTVPVVTAVRGCHQHMSSTMASMCLDGDTLTIFGSSFPPTAGATHVHFNNTLGSVAPRCGEVTYASYDKIVCTLSVSSSLAMKGPFSVIVTDARTQEHSLQSAVQINTAAYAPNVTSVSGCSNSSSNVFTRGCTNGTVLTITGSGFASTPSRNRVYLTASGTSGA